MKLGSNYKNEIYINKFIKNIKFIAQVPTYIIIIYTYRKIKLIKLLKTFDVLMKFKIYMNK